MKLKLVSALAAGLLSAAPAFAVTIDFQGAGEYNFIGDYYNGGTNDAGATGANYGISFGPDAFVAANGPAFTYFANEPTPGAMTAMQLDPNVASNAVMNVAFGFTGPVLFSYSALADATVTVYSGLNGTGTNLGTFSLFANNSDCGEIAICHWDVASLNLSEVAHSIQFGTAANAVFFDNISVNQVPVPAAGWLMFSAVGALGAAARRKRSA